MTYIELGKRIKLERERRGWDQATLAVRLGKGQQAISRWEAGGSRPRQDDVLRLSALFNGDPEEWILLAGYPLKKPDMSLVPTLPINTLSPENFESFCRDLIQELSPTADVHKYGVPGDDQEGIDIYAQTTDKILDYQCKRHQQFGAADITNAIKANEFTANHHHILLSRRADTRARKAVIGNRDWSLWDIEDIAVKVRSLELDRKLRLVDHYFPGYRTKFLGIDQPSPWLKADDFFGRLLDRSKLFNHSWEFVGRSHELQALQDFHRQKDTTALIVEGRGGVGKSRLIKAWVDGMEKNTVVRFLSPGSEVGPSDFEKLPKGPAYLVIDDGHERDDLKSILTGISINRSETKVIISVRPYGSVRTKDILSNAGVSYEEDKTIKLSDLEQVSSEKLSSEILRTEGGNTDYAKRIAEITKDCPLATVIGSQLVGRKFIQPNILANEKEFKKELLGRFRDVIAGNVGGSNPDAIRSLLNLIATIQPLDPLDPIFQSAAQQILERSTDDISRDIDSLEDAGVLLRRGNRVRIVPDLLSDYIRAEAAFDERSGRSRKYVDKVFGVLQNDLATNLLSNISQLDWRLVEDGVQSTLLKEIWTTLKEQFRKAKLHERIDILKALEKVAYYQPAEVLEFVRIALTEPTDKVEKEVLRIASGKPSYQEVINYVSPILRYVAYHQDHLIEVLDILRELALKDARRPNQYTNHPLRVLQDLASIEPGKPIGYNKAVVDHVLGWIPMEWSSHFSPFDILDEVLETEGHTSESKGYKVIMKAYKVRPEAVADLRKVVLECAFETIRTRSLDTGFRALKTIENGLRYPIGIFGSEVTEQEVNAWEPGIIETLKQLSQLVKDHRVDPFVAVEVRQAISPFMRRHRSTTINEIISETLSSIPTTPTYEISRAIMDSWGWTFYGDDEEHPRRSEEALTKWRNCLAETLTHNYKENPDALIQIIEERIDTSKKVKTHHQIEAGPFLDSLMKASQPFAQHLAKYLVSNPISPINRWFHIVVMSSEVYNPAVAIDLMKKGLETENEVVVEGVAFALGSRWRKAEITDNEIEMLRALSSHKSNWVRKSIVGAVARFPINKKPLGLNMLLEIDWGQSTEVAEEVLGEFDKEHGSFKMSDLSTEQVQSIAHRLVSLPSVDDYAIVRFVSEMSYQFPKLTSQMMKDRVEYKEKENTDIGEYDVFPTRWDKSDPLRFFETSEYRNILCDIRDWSSEKVDSWVRFHYGSDLFKMISNGFDQTTIQVLDEWMETNDPRKFRAAAALIGEAKRSFIWSNPELVASILDRAQKVGSDCYQHVSHSLHHCLIKGGKSGTPGEPFPEDIDQRDRAQKLMQEQSPGSPTYRFYKMVHDYARGEIERHMKYDRIEE